MRDLLTKKCLRGESLAGSYLQKKFQWMDCNWRMLHSNGRLAGSESDQAGSTSKVQME